MNILYYSVHAILEDDEVRLFQGLGHNVCCLGINGKDGQIQDYRPAIAWNKAELALYEKLYELGGSSYFNHVAIPREFIELFDVCLIMHNAAFIQKHWDVLRVRPVVWRTIGQAIDQQEDSLRILRDQGLSIVRYSLMENYIPHGLKQDAFIRFTKDPGAHTGWVGTKSGVLTFVNNFKGRYPNEYADYRAITAGLDSFLGGVANEGHSNSYVSAEAQKALYSQYMVYLHAANLDSPYTLNFIEAWMTGIPVVLYAPYDRISRFFEMDRLIVDGVNGFVCRDVASAKAKVRLLLNDRQVAKRIGEAGRAAAIFYFGSPHIRLEWEALLQSVANSEKQASSMAGQREPKNPSGASSGSHSKQSLKGQGLVSRDEESRNNTMHYITPHLASFERKESSQWAEDGVLEKIAQDLGIECGSFFEFGIGPADGTSYHKGMEGNFVALAKRGWKGVFLDGQTYPPECGVRQAFVTALNINQLYKSHGVAQDLDFMSIDVDGQDFWIWMALEAKPKLMVVEYNACLGEEASVTVQFDVDFRWDGTIYQGASLKAFVKLAKSKGYTLVYTNGVNAIFLRNDVVANKDDFAQDAMFKPYPMPALPADGSGRTWVSI